MLIVIVNANGEQVVLEDGDRAVVGRGSTSDVVLDAADVSRSHLILEQRDGRWFAVDDGSANGTFHAGQKISELPIDENLELRLGTSDEGSISLQVLTPVVLDDMETVTVDSSDVVLPPTDPVPPPPPTSPTPPPATPAPPPPPAAPAPPPTAPAPPPAAPAPPPAAPAPPPAAPAPPPAAPAPPPATPAPPPSPPAPTTPMAVAPAAYDEPAPPPGLVPPPGGPPGPPGYTPPPPATGGGSKTALLAVFGFLAFCFVGIAAFVLLRAGDDDTAVSPAPPVATTQPFSPPAPPPTPAPTTTPAPPPPTTVTPTTVPPTTVPATTVPPPTTTVPPPTTTVPPSTTAAPSTETYAVVHGIIVMLDVPCDNLAAEGYDDVPTLQVDILDVDENFLINMPPGPLGAVDVDDGCAVRFEGVDLPRRDAYLVSTLERGQIEIFVEDFTNDDGVDTIFAVSLGG